MFQGFNVSKVLPALALCVPFACLPLSALGEPSKRECAKKSQIKPVAAFPKLPALSQPLDMIQAPNDPSIIFVALRDGQIVSFDNSPDADKLILSLDIRKKVNNQVENGLVGIALHPKYPEDPRIFVQYNDSTQGNQSTLASFKVDPNSRIIDPSSEEVLITLPKEALFHNGGNLVFGNDGYLYSAFGDGGFTPWYSEDTDNLFGSMIRIDVNTTPYSAPADNPLNEGQATCPNAFGDDDCPEIYAYGFRNPWRFSFDRETNKLWLADVGEDDFDEINIVEPDKNYGWPTIEGTSCFTWKLCIWWGREYPHNGYDNEGAQSIVGGYVYRGKAMPSLVGKYIFGDTFVQNFFALDADAEPNAPFEEIFNAGFMVASMAEDHEGEVYLLNFSGTKVGEGIYRLEEVCD